MDVDRAREIKEEIIYTSRFVSNAISKSTLLLLPSSGKDLEDLMRKNAEEADSEKMKETFNIRADKVRRMREVIKELGSLSSEIVDLTQDIFEWGHKE